MRESSSKPYIPITENPKDYDDQCLFVVAPVPMYNNNNNTHNNSSHKQDLSRSVNIEEENSLCLPQIKSSPDNHVSTKSPLIASLIQMNKNSKNTEQKFNAFVATIERNKK